MLSQRIIGYDVHHLRMPVVSRRDHGIGSVSDGVEVVLLCLTTEDGAQGWGEAACWSVFTGTPEASFAALHRYFRPLVQGRPVGDMAVMLDQAGHLVAHCTEAKAALETALLDLTGRIAGLPVWALLGGKVRDAIPLSCSIANPDFDADLALMDRLQADGVRIIKLKAGFKDPAVLQGKHPHVLRRRQEIAGRIAADDRVRPAQKYRKPQDVREVARPSPSMRAGTSCAINRTRGFPSKVWSLGFASG